METENFNWALDQLKSGYLVKREKWPALHYLSMLVIMSEEKFAEFAAAGEAEIEKGVDPLDVTAEYDESEDKYLLCKFLGSDADEWEVDWTAKSEDLLADDWVALYSPYGKTIGRSFTTG